MNVRFHLRDPRSNVPTAIFAIISYNNKSVKVYIRESINPKYWNQDNQQARTSPKFPESPEFNQRLINVRAGISRVFLNYRNSHDDAFPPPDEMKRRIDTMLQGGTASVSLLEYFDAFVKRSEAGERMNPNKQKAINPANAKGYRTTLNKLIEFNAASKRKVDFATIDLEFHRDFITFLTTKPNLLSANTVGSHIKRLKCVMAEATEAGINKNLAFRSKYFVKPSEAADTIYLNDAELAEMQKLELDEVLDNVRDLFLIGAFTGLRISDFKRLEKGNFSVDGRLRIMQTKTTKPVTIPVHSVVKGIIEKRNGELPRRVSDQKFNKYLKDIGEKMESLSVIVTKCITKGGVKTYINKPKWEMLSSHCARRSFATNNYLKGVPTSDLIRVGGWASESNLLKYLKVSADDHAGRIEKIWDAKAV